MEDNLFSKYIKIIKDKNNIKDVIINEVYKKTGIFLKKEEIDLNGKKIKLNISSVKKFELKKKGIDGVIKKLKLEYI